MKKKRIGWLAFLCLICIVACNQDKSHLISINVQLIQIPKNEDAAYLDVIRPTKTITIDTAEINPLKGNFSFQIYSENAQALYRIRTGRHHSFLLVAGDEDITITGAYAKVGAMQITGSEATVELQHFLTSLNRQNASLNKEAKVINNPANQFSDSLIRIKKHQLQQGKQALLDSILQKARTTSSPVVALFALSILDDKDAWEKGKPVFDGLTTRFPKNKLVKEAVNNYKKKLNNQGKSMAVGIGDQAPNLSYPSPNGNIVSLSDYKGKYVLLDFWASWCAPCRAANPELVKAYNHFKDKNFTILGVSLDSKKSSWIKAVKKDGLIWKQISDLKGWNSQPAAVYNIEAIPANYLINPDGKIIAKNLYGDSLTIKLDYFLTNNQE